MAKVVEVGDGLRTLDASEMARLEAGQVISTVRRSPPGVEVQTLLGCSPAHMLGLLTNYADMPRHIVGLERAEVLDRVGEATTVRFTMKLPFPVGRVVWSNLIEQRRLGETHSLAWTLLDGDLEVNEGQLAMSPHRGQPDRTYARYVVRVQSRIGLPKSAETLATRWLLPRIITKLRHVAER